MDSSRRVSFTALLVRALRHSADFSGRSTRAELVVTFIAAILFGSLTSLAFMLFGWPSSSHSVLALNLISILPFPALLARRMHDQGRRLNRFGADPRGHKKPLNPPSEYDPPAASPSA